MAAEEYYRASRASQRGGRDHSPDYAYGGASQARLAYEPQTPFYPPPGGAGGGATLQVPDNTRARPRSLPPPALERRKSSFDRERGWNPHGDSDESDDGRHHRALAVRDKSRDRGRRDRTPLGKAREVLDNTFSTSKTGLGVGVLGALVGGLAAHEASEATSRHSGSHGDPAHKRNQILSTVVGAAVGALGANAVEKRLEANRVKDREEEERWERKWRPGSRGGEPEYVEKREIIKRPRSRHGGEDGGWRRDLDDGADSRRRSRGSHGGGSRAGGGPGLEREVDPDARSWRDVEDWVYDDRSGDSRGGRGSRSDGYRF